MTLGRLFRRKTFDHGVHPRDFKDLTSGLAIRRLPFAPRLTLLLSQHAGAPSRPLVRPGQEVVRGEPVAEAAGYVSVPLHAPATGVVRGIELVATAQGPKAPAILLDVYQGASQEILYEAPPDLQNLSREDLQGLLQGTGIVGLGGAAFPTHVKLRPPEDAVLDTLIANGCECEPYLTCDHRIMLERTDDLIAGTQLMMRALDVHRAMIGVEDNKRDAVKAIRSKIPANSGISVHAVETKYPQGAEKMLIESLLRRQVPSGGLPSAVGVAVFNVGTLAAIGDLLPRGRGLVERLVTVSGTGVSRPGNYLVPLGTPVRYLLEHAGAKPEAHEVILGGPMMGMSVASLDVPVTKGMSGMVVLEQRHSDLKPRQVFPCIHCARCVEACPMHLNPSLMGQLAAKREYTTVAQEHHLFDCFECGCCSYVCPSNIPLVQYFRIAKAINREQAA